MQQIGQVSYLPEQTKQFLQTKPIAKQKSLKSSLCVTFGLKMCIIILITLTFFLYKLFYHQSSTQCIYDRLHDWTTLLNQKLHQNNQFYEIMLTLCQESIQANILLVAILYALKIKNLKAPCFFILFYGIRAILIEIQRFPYPPAVKWDPPNILSWAVPYGITRDYFYSGHSGFMLFCTLLWKQLGFVQLFLCCYILTPFVMLIILATRVHYTIDIVGAAIFTFWIKSFLLKHLALFDKVMGYLVKNAFKILKLKKKTQI